MLVGDDPGLERAGGRVERVDGRVDPLLHDRARERRRRVEVGEHVRRRRVGEVVGGDVDRLDRGDRALARRGDPLLELAHLGRERRLVADGARHPAEERRDLGAGLHEPEDVVDEEEDVLALLAEVLRHRQPGEADAQAGARRLVHLAVDERDLVDHARLLHLEHQVVALAGPLADAGEHGDTAVLLGDVVDQLHDRHGLADSGAAEEADLAALDVGGDQVDHLDPGLEDLDGRREVAEGGRVAVDRPALDVRAGGLLVVDGGADHVPDPAERGVAHGDRDRLAGVDDVDAAGEPVGRVHRDGANAVVAQVLLHLGHERRRLRALRSGDRDLEGVVDRGQGAREHGVDHDALDLDDAADVAAVAVLGLLRHGSPVVVPRLLQGPRSGAGTRRGTAANARSSYRSAEDADPVHRRSRRGPGTTPPGRRGRGVSSRR